MKKIIFIKYSFLLLFILFSFNQILFAQDNIEYIFNIKPEGYVVDFANIISSEEEIQIFNLAKVIDSNSKNQICVVTVKSLGLYTIEEFSYKLLEKWGIGQKELNNGILIVLALNEKKVRIEVGYGLEYLITDSNAALIIQRYGIPYFKDSKYGIGLYNIVYKLGETIAKSKKEDFTNWLKNSGIEAENENSGSGFFFIILLFIMFFILSIFFRRPFYYGYRNRSMANQLFGAYLASSILRNTFFGNNIGSTKNSGFGGFKGGGFGGFGGFGGGSSGGGGATGGW
ncbi:MAG: TPM domain-containing protein [Exilispira sp.]